MLSSNPDIVQFLDSDGAVVPINLLRLNSLSLAYSLPTSWISKLKMSSCQFVVSSNNVLKFTNYKGLDPESFNSYAPPLRTITLSFNCSF